MKNQAKPLKDSTALLPGWEFVGRENNLVCATLVDDEGKQFPVASLLEAIRLIVREEVTRAKRFA